MRPLLVVGLMLAAGSSLPGQEHQHGGAHAPHGKTVPHPYDPVLRAEHMALLDLIRPEDATHTAVHDGAWSEPRTWKDGRLPGRGAVVLVPEGMAVTMDLPSEVPLRAVRVDGRLAFAPDRDTCLVVDTVIVAPSGRLTLGTAEQPIARDRQARLVFEGHGLIDTDWDPTLLSRGLITHGAVSLHGAPVTPYVAVARPPLAGDTKLVLAKAPVNWKKGDYLVLSGTHPPTRSTRGGKASTGKQPSKEDGGKGGKRAAKDMDEAPESGKKGGKGKQPEPDEPVDKGSKKGAGKNDPGDEDGKANEKTPDGPVHKGSHADDKGQAGARETTAGLPNRRRGGVTEDEALEVVAVAGNEVTVAEPVRYDHVVPAEGLSAYVANLTRNVVLESRNPRDVNERGHVMFMHSPDVSLAYAGFYALGRTNKNEPLTDPILDRHSKLIPETGKNPRGRYAVHFHRTGVEPGQKAVVVRGCAVADTPGWGFVNHSSNIVMEENIAYDTDGAGFVTEAGDELGAFRRNLAIRSVGSGVDALAREDEQDFGHEGVGFWIQGGGVALEENIAAGHHEAAYSLFTLGLVQPGLGRMRFPVANLTDPSWARGTRTVEIGEVPLRSFKGNIAFASDFGIVMRFHLSGPKYGGAKCPERSVLEGGAVWNTRVGIHILYTHKMTLRNIRLVGSFGHGKERDCAYQGVIEGVQDFRYENLRVEGWDTGINVGEAGDHTIDGGSYYNRVNIYVPLAVNRNRAVFVQGDVHFGQAQGEATRGASEYDVFMDAQSKILPASFKGRDPNILFWPAPVVLDTPQYRNKQVYYPEEAPDHVLFRDDPGVGVPAELLGQTNRELWDRYGVALGGVLPPADARPDPRIHGLVGSPAQYPEPLYPGSLHSERLRHAAVSCVREDKRQAAARWADLNEGWNLVTLSVQNHPRSFLIYGGAPQRAGHKVHTKSIGD
jgi:hypothetical protein